MHVMMLHCTKLKILQNSVQQSITQLFVDKQLMGNGEPLDFVPQQIHNDLLGVIIWLVQIFTCTISLHNKMV